MLVTDIDCYVKYLQSEAGFFISLQPSRQEAVVNNNLMHYDMHANPYCIYIKTEQARWERCIQHHESVFAKQKKEPCFCMCPAGVWEYAYPVYHGEEKWRSFMSAAIVLMPQKAMRRFVRTVGIRRWIIKAQRPFMRNI